MSFRDNLKGFVYNFHFLQKYLLKLRTKQGYLIPDNKMQEFLDVAENVLLENKAKYNELKVGVVKDGTNFPGLTEMRAYFPKYERFLRANDINYEYYDILNDNWQEEAKKFDVIIWHTNSDPATQCIAGNKFYVLDKLMGKKCLPSFDELWSYEDKINMHYLYEHYELPGIPTFVSHSKEDTLHYLKKAKFPIVSKLVTGSGSEGVEKFDSESKATNFVNKVFSYKGARTCYPFQRQKDYVLFQEFIDDATYDLRIIVIGNKLLGYYRYPNEGDFRASGSGKYAKKGIAVEALDLAFKVKELFTATCLATDLLYSAKEQKYYIIESSIFIGVDSASQLEIDGVAGYYERVNEGEYIFNEGKYWIQELTLNELFSNL